MKPEFERFRQIALADAPPEAMHSAELIFMAGAVSASARILDILQSELPMKRQCALLRRVSRECLAFQLELQDLPPTPPAEEHPNGQ